MSEWIDCKVKLPPFEQCVKVRSAYGCQIGVYFSGSWHIDKEFRLILHPDCKWYFPSGIAWKHCDHDDQWKEFNWREED